MNIIQSIAKLQSQSTTNPCSISQMAAKHASNQISDFLIKWTEKFERRKSLFAQFF